MFIVRYDRTVSLLPTHAKISETLSELSLASGSMYVVHVNVIRCLQYCDLLLIKLLMSLGHLMTCCEISILTLMGYVDVIHIQEDTRCVTFFF